MCPCPRCLVPKSEMYLMGFVRDISARISKVRKYFGDSVRAARRHIYHSAYAIGSDKVNDVLKQTSSVPTLVSTSLYMDVDRHITSFCVRTHSLNVLVMTSIFTRCSSSTLCYARVRTWGVEKSIYTPNSAFVRAEERPGTGGRTQSKVGVAQFPHKSCLILGLLGTVKCLDSGSTPSDDLRRMRPK